jgi:WD40 repeat protein
MYLSDRGDDGSDGDFRCVGTIRKHDTGIQSLKWSTSGRYLFSSGGCEEFYVWQVSAAPILGVGVSCESSLPVQGKRSEQRISDFAVLVETETESEVQFQLTLVYSNSFIKTYRYKRDDVGEHWALICQTQYTTACLTAVDAIRIDTAALLLIGATDGHVSIWAERAAGGSSCQLSSPRCINLHQNSVKTMSIAQLSPTTALVLAGGDDNAISFILIRGTRGHSEMSTTSVVMPRAHAASVTASALFIQIPPSNGENKFRLRAMTSWNDQRIKIWDIDINLGLPDADAISVKRTANQASAVADISAIAVFPGVDGGKEGCVQNAKKLLVCGVGFEVWNLSKWAVLNLCEQEER